MQFSRRRFIRTAAAGAAATAVVLSLPEELRAVMEPGRAPRLDGKGHILLNSNENAYGAFASAKEAMMEAISVSNRYPDREFEALLEGLGRLHRVSAENIAIGSGSTDILRMAASAFVGRNNRLVTAAPTFEAMGLYVERRGAQVVKIPLRSDYAHDLEAMLDSVKKEPADLIYICNPNNPTGSITPRKEIETFLQQLPEETMVLIDEAYHHFVSPEVDYRSFADHPVDDPRVIVARTFSKVYGMAGLRVGYSLSQPEPCRKLSRFIVFDSPNCIAARAAVAALKDDRALQQATAQIIADRQEFVKQAQTRKLKMIPSQANFVMIETGRPIRQVIDHFKQHNVIIGRPFPPYLTYARISLGTPAEMQEFWRIFDAMGRNPQA